MSVRIPERNEVAQCIKCGMVRIIAEAGMCGNCVIGDHHTANKQTEGKLDFSLLPWEPIREIVKVYMFGCKKYSRNNWRKGSAWSEWYAAVLRHLTSWIDGEDKDPESGLSHLAHAAWGIITLLWFSIHRSEFDDRNEEEKI